MRGYRIGNVTLLLIIWLIFEHTMAWINGTSVNELVTVALVCTIGITDILESRLA